MGAVKSALSRRVSEIVGVAMFASALIWLIALASYEPSDPVWFFSTGTEAPANFVGRVGAFIAELSFQLLGYGSYVLPTVVVVVGWHYFWCRDVDAAYTKAFGAGLVLASTSAFFSLVLGTVDVGDRSFRAGGYLGDFLAGMMSDYLSQTGSIIVILALLFVAIILSTQFSFGRAFTIIAELAQKAMRSGWMAARRWMEERRKARQRREVIAKHVKKGTAPEVVKAAVERAVSPEQTPRVRAPPPVRWRARRSTIRTRARTCVALPVRERPRPSFRSAQGHRLLPRCRCRNPSRSVA